MTTIGLPRALLYYRYAPAFCAFFEALGARVVVSPPTTTRTLTRGSARVVSETCFPVKLFCGHVLELVDQVDLVFVPAVHRLRAGTRNCPKLVGLPDLARAVIPEAPLLSIDIDSEGRWLTFSQLVGVCTRYFTSNPLLVKQAADRARSVWDEYDRLLQSGVDLQRALVLQADETASTPPDTLTIAVIGHPYNLHDEYASHRLLHRLRSMGVRVVTPLRLSAEERWKHVDRLASAPYWTYEDEVVGAAGAFLERGVDGILVVCAFGCAPDSVMLSVVVRAAAGARVPHLELVLDEHSGEAGLVTRLEAFVDMLARRKEKRE